MANQRMTSEEFEFGMADDEDSLRIPSKKQRESLIHEVEEISGESVFRCNQCGKCTACCPFVAEMDLKPNQVIRLVQMGHLDVLNRDAIWFCASCMLCGARCPKGVDLAKIMEALRKIIHSKKIDRVSPHHFEPEELKDMPNIAMVCAFRKNTG